MALSPRKVLLEERIGETIFARNNASLETQATAACLVSSRYSMLPK